MELEHPVMRALRARFTQQDWRLAIGALVADVQSLGGSTFSAPPINIVLRAGVSVDAAAAIVELMRLKQAISEATREAPHGRLQ